MGRKNNSKALDKAIEALWRKHGNGVAVNIMDIPKIFADARAAFAASPTDAALEGSILASVAKYRAV